MKKISVIVPIYNSERYLRKCLDSLVNQTLKDIETHLDDADLVEYLSKKYDSQFNVKFDDTQYDNSEINKYFTNYSGYIEGNEDRKYGILNQDDGLLLILALLTDKIERECINWSADN